MGAIPKNPRKYSRIEGKSKENEGNYQLLNYFCYFVTTQPILNYIEGVRYTHVKRILIVRSRKPQKNLMVIFFVIHIFVIACF